jgi:hypothetical protein|tara:strand:+ start:91 stop:498 length:408 start_codon:yes stop_codon:yes gene_type:complete
MPVVRLTFNYPINVSVQLGDVVYYCETLPVGPNRVWAGGTTPHLQGDQSGIFIIGDVVGIYQWDGVMSWIDADMDDTWFNSHGPPGPNDFIMFSKDNKVNLSTMSGYYAIARWSNNSTDEAELFTVGADIYESSK